MGAGRIYWGQVLAVLSVLMLGAAFATQWTAAQLGYQPALGAPDAVLFGTPIYAPWRFFIWWFQYDSYARPIFEAGGAIVLAGSVLSVLTAFGFSLWRSRDEKRSKTYGTARWAERRDIERLKLTQGDGVILGLWRGHLLRHDGDEHVLVIAPTNTGKSVGVSLPTIALWRDITGVSPDDLDWYEDFTALKIGCLAVSTAEIKGAPLPDHAALAARLKL